MEETSYFVIRHRFTGEFVKQQMRDGSEANKPALYAWKGQAFKALGSRTHGDGWGVFRVRLVVEEEVTDDVVVGEASVPSPVSRALLKRAIRENPGISTAELGRMFNVHKSTISRRLKIEGLVKPRSGRTRTYGTRRSHEENR